VWANWETVVLKPATHDLHHGGLDLPILVLLGKYY